MSACRAASRMSKRKSAGGVARERRRPSTSLSRANKDELGAIAFEPHHGCSRGQPRLRPACLIGAGAKRAQRSRCSDAPRPWVAVSPCLFSTRRNRLVDFGRPVWVSVCHDTHSLHTRNRSTPRTKKYLFDIFTPVYSFLFVCDCFVANWEQHFVSMEPKSELFVCC
jgi:hypothetical protein